MSQASITNFYLPKKRKFTADGEIKSEKFQLIQDPKTPEKVPMPVPSSPRTSTRVVTKLNFDDVDTVKNVTNVPFRKLRNLSPVKRIEPSETSDVAVAARSEPSIEGVKKALSRSSRLNELKSRLDRFNANYDKLKTQSTSQSSENAALKEFKSIEVDVPVSPVKKVTKNASPFTSPVKSSLPSLRSPLKSPVKAPAYQRYASLTATTPTLTLPYHYKFLAEVFRAVDAACSMLHNRRETITFAKIKVAAQDMLKKNVTEKHLSQIIHLSPNMYSFSWEKLKNFGMTSKKEVYDLVITPNIVNKITGSPVETMTPTVVIERQRSFYNLLIEKVKDHHDAFLKTLEVPMNISRTELKCWHPEFELERLPDIECEDLPKAPVIEKYSTAQDVLSKAREMFSNNPRVERALKKLADAKLKTESNEESQSNQSTQTTSTTPEVHMVNPALRGLPAALLLKVKARQAEKAMQTMTRTLIQNENILQYQRLPDLARILRNLFVTEKKCVLPLETVVSKLDNSFSSKLSSEELLKQLKLLSTEVPDWLTFHNIRKTDFLKMAKNVEMATVLNKLESLANKYSS